MSPVAGRQPSRRQQTVALMCAALRGSDDLKNMLSPGGDPKPDEMIVQEAVEMLKTVCDTVPR